MAHTSNLVMHMPGEITAIRGTGGGMTLQTAERSASGGRSVPRLARQCTCPYCGGCFGFEDDGRTERVTEYDCQCTRCGHAWKSRVPEPVKCPGCGVNGWRSKPESCRCLRCGHEWTPRGRGHRPSRCPECKSKYWNGVPEKPSRPIPPPDAPEILHRRWIMKKYGDGRGCLKISLETGIALFEVIGVLQEELGAQQPKLRRPRADAFIFKVKEEQG